MQAPPITRSHSSTYPQKFPPQPSPPGIGETRYRAVFWKIFLRSTNWPTWNEGPMMENESCMFNGALLNLSPFFMYFNDRHLSKTFVCLPWWDLIVASHFTLTFDCGYDFGCWFFHSYCCEFLRHLYLEPVCPVFWWLKPPKQQGLLQSKQRAQFGFQLYADSAPCCPCWHPGCQGIGPPPKEIRPTIKRLLTHWFPFIRPKYWALFLGGVVTLGGSP